MKDPFLSVFCFTQHINCLSLKAERNIKLPKGKKDVNPKYQCKPNLRKHELLHDEAAAAGWSVDPGLGEVTVIINVWRCVIINRLNLPGVPILIDFYFSVL